MTERLDQIKREIDEQAKLISTDSISIIGRDMRLAIFGMLLEMAPQNELLSEDELVEAREYLSKLRDVDSV